MNKRGFTLMEVLAVVLMMAVVASLAIPGVRAARFETKHSQAKAAAKQLITGINNYRVTTRGGTVESGIVKGGEQYFGDKCETATIGSTGIPAQTAGMPLTQLAPCGFVSAKDFRELPYQFYYGSAIPSTLKENIAGTGKVLGEIVLVAVGKDSKAGKYYNANLSEPKYAIYIDSELTPKEYEQ